MALLSSQPVSLPTALPSPTLTNPDMILPYRSSSLSASPVAQRLPQQFFTSARLDSRQGATHHRNDSLEGSMQKLFGNSGRLDHSRARVDHKVRQKSRERLFLTPSPTPDDEPDYTRVGDFHHPKIIDGHWQGFDGPSEDVVVQFHDNEPQRSVEVKVAPRKIRPAPVNGTQEIRAILDEDENDPHSHAAMSRRAENILANAKKRLLVRARPFLCVLPWVSPLIKSRQWKIISAVLVIVSMHARPLQCRRSEAITPGLLRSRPFRNTKSQAVTYTPFGGTQTRLVRWEAAKGIRESSVKRTCRHRYIHEQNSTGQGKGTRKNPGPSR